MKERMNHRSMKKSVAKANDSGMDVSGTLNKCVFRDSITRRYSALRGTRKPNRGSMKRARE